MTDTIPWWADHQNLALTGYFMAAQGHEIGDILYMLEKPYKHNDDFELAKAEQDLPFDLRGT